MLRAMEFYARKRDEWPFMHELLAIGAEIQHAVLRFHLNSNRRKGQPPIGKPLHIKRPWEDTPKPMGMTAFAARVRRG